MQALRQSRRSTTLAFTCSRGIGATEYREEVRSERGVRQFHSPRTGWHAIELRYCTTHIIDGIEQNFCGQPLRIKAGIAVGVADVELIGGRTQLVGGRGANRSDQMLEIKPGLGQFLSKSVEQFWIARWIGNPHIVFGFHQPAS